MPVFWSLAVFNEKNSKALVVELGLRASFCGRRDVLGTGSLFILLLRQCLAPFCLWGQGWNVWHHQHSLMLNAHWLVSPGPLSLKLMYVFCAPRHCVELVNKTHWRISDCAVHVHYHRICMWVFLLTYLIQWNMPHWDRWEGGTSSIMKKLHCTCRDLTGAK